MTTRRTADQRRAVFDRAEGCCEYCLLHDSLTFAAHEVDHIIADKHGGQKSLDNLALSCSKKGCSNERRSLLRVCIPQGGKFADLSDDYS